MTTDTNGAGGLPVSEKYDAYYDHPGNTCQYPGHMKLQYPNGEFHYLPAGTRLFIEHGELCRATREGDRDVEKVARRLELACTDYDGSAIDDLAEPLPIHAGALRSAARLLRTLSRVAVQEDTTDIDPNETTAALRGMEKDP